MAYKVFQNGFPLNASELNNYLMNQSVMVFASTTARDADLTAPTEGMIVWLQDSNKFVYYNGSGVWTDVNVTGNGANAIINGAFDIWQRGTSFSLSSGGVAYTADRFLAYADGGSAVYSQQTFTPGAAPVSGYESAFFLREVAGAGARIYIEHKIEDVRTFAGQTATLSFWAKAGAAFTLKAGLTQAFGSGGSTWVTIAEPTFSLTTSWARYSYTYTIPSLSGKNLGANGHNLDLIFSSTATAQTLDIWGIQLEAGSSATPFKRNAPSLQAEKATCQGFNYRVSADASTPYTYFGHATAGSSTTLRMPFYTKTSLRTFASAVEWGGSIIATTGNGSIYAITNVAIDAYSKEVPALVLTVASGLTTNTTYIIRADNSATAYIGLPAEL